MNTQTVIQPTFPLNPKNLEDLTQAYVYGIQAGSRSMHNVLVAPTNPSIYTYAKVESVSKTAIDASGFLGSYHAIEAYTKARLLLENLIKHKPIVVMDTNSDMLWHRPLALAAIDMELLVVDTHMQHLSYRDAKAKLDKEMIETQRLIRDGRLHEKYLETFMSMDVETNTLVHTYRQVQTFMSYEAEKIRSSAYGAEKIRNSDTPDIIKEALRHDVSDESGNTETMTKEERVKSAFRSYIIDMAHNYSVKLSEINEINDADKPVPRRHVAHMYDSLLLEELANDLVFLMTSSK